MTTRSVIIASAGSGKTFTLSNRLIGWMVHRLRTERDPGCARVSFSRVRRGTRVKTTAFLCLGESTLWSKAVKP